ncbi:MAG: class E sortase [Nocardioides sp.]|uniref:sortase n=1 Tax=Nocardioides sp. TaxID=35761 RepID=UPI0039E2258E
MSAPTAVRTEPVDASRPSSGTRVPWRSGTSQALFAVALVLLWVIAYVLLLSGLEQRHAQRRLYDQLRTELALGTAPTGAPIASGHPVSLLDIPAIGVSSLVVVEGIRAEQLVEAPGHAPGSVLPGQQGTSVILGKGLTYGAPFGHLDQLRVGDPIAVTTAQGRFVFHVSGTRRAGATSPAAPAAGSARLTLVTASGRGRGGALRPSETFYVDADLVGTSVARGVMSGPDPDGVPMTSKVSAGLLAQLVLALQLLTLVVGGVVWAWHRWSERAAWLVGAPAVIASVWLASSLAGRLIPGLI